MCLAFLFRVSLSLKKHLIYSAELRLNSETTSDQCLHCLLLEYSLNSKAGRYSSVGSDVAWESRGTGIDPPVWHIFS